MDAKTSILLLILLFIPATAISSNSSHHECAKAKKCLEDGGVVIRVAWKPVEGYSTLETVLRAAVYLLGLFYMFLGVALIADIFMEAIEVVTSQTYTKVLPASGGKVYEVKVWNETVANLTLMALGSSAPEILLSAIEIAGNDFKAGDLGPGTTVGSAAFNLLVITAVCVYSIPSGEGKKINNMPVFVCTASWSLFAYVWLYLMISVISPGRIQIGEGVMTLVFFVIFILNSYLIDVRGDRCMHLIGFKVISVTEVETAAAARMQNGGGANSTFVKPVHENGGTISFDNPKVLPSPAAAAAAADDSPHDAAVSPAAGQATKKQILEIVNGLKRRYGGDKKLLREKIVEEVTELLMAGRGKAYYRKHMADIEQKKKQLENQIEAMISNMQHVDVVSEERNILFVDPLTTKFPESVGVARIMLRREGPFTQTTSRVKFRTSDGNAISNRTAETKVDESADYIHTEGTVTFFPNECQHPIYVEILDDAEYEDDEDFYLEFWDLEEIPLVDKKYKPPTLKDKRVQCIILDDDHFGEFEFLQPEVEVSEDSGSAVLKLIRMKGCQGHIRIWYDVRDGSAVAETDYRSVHTIVVDFQDKQTEKEIEIELINNLQLEEDSSKYFTVKLTHLELLSSDENLTEECRPTIGRCNECCVTIISAGQTEQSMENLMRASEDPPRTYSDQFRSVFTVKDDDEGPAGALDVILFVLQFPFKLLFAFVPPPALLGGLPCFVASICTIGMITAVIGDLATFFGCTIGLKDAVTAITVVALGTSLPDTFASKIAAQNDKYADSSIGNITGSNAVNVFLGVGVAWLMGSVYQRVVNDADFVVEEGGDLGLSVAAFLALALVAIATLMVRRITLGAELGGPQGVKLFSAALLVLLWLIYVSVSTANTFCLF